VLDVAAASREVRQALAPYAGLKVVTFHKAWDYFAEAVGVEVAGTIEPQVSITPSAAQVQQTVEMMRRQGVKIVVCETYSDDKLARYVAERAGAVLVVLPDHVRGVPAADSYQKLLRYNADKLIEAAKAAGVTPHAAAAAGRTGG
jgi:ABC-type Zn uptake system ZnuABC Zn-binding protein ZnuA